MRVLSKIPFSSISLAKGRTFSSANWRMLSRKRSSSSVRVVRGVGAGACSVVSGIGIPSRMEPVILALRGLGVMQGQADHGGDCDDGRLGHFPAEEDGQAGCGDD